MRNNEVLFSQAGALNEASLRATVEKALQGPKRMTFRF